MIGATRFHSTLRGTRPGVNLYARMGILPRRPFDSTAQQAIPEFFVDSLPPFAMWGVKIVALLPVDNSGAPTTHDPTRTMLDPCANSARLGSIRGCARRGEDVLETPVTRATRAIPH